MADIVSNLGLGSMSGMFIGWMQSGVFWVIIVMILTASTLVLLWWRKQTKLKYNVFELVSFGNGKVGINKLKAGIFKTQSALGGLIDYGNETRFKCSDGRIIRDASTDDLHDIFGKKGFLVRRKDDDPKILVPISEVRWRNEEALFAIAPSDFRDASVEIIGEATKETQGFMEKYLPYIMLGAIVVFFVIAMIVASQFFSRTVDKAADLLLQAGQNAGNVAKSSAP